MEAGTEGWARFLSRFVASYQADHLARHGRLPYLAAARLARTWEGRPSPEARIVDAYRRFNEALSDFAHVTRQLAARDAMTRTRRDHALLIAGNPIGAPVTDVRQVVLSTTAISMASAIGEIYKIDPKDIARLAALYTHSMELGLALICLSHDEPATFEATHDASLDLIDEVREALGEPPLGGHVCDEQCIQHEQEVTDAGDED